MVIRVDATSGLPFQSTVGVGCVRWGGVEEGWSGSVVRVGGWMWVW